MLNFKIKVFKFCLKMRLQLFKTFLMLRFSVRTVISWPENRNGKTGLFLSVSNWLPPECMFSHWDNNLIETTFKLQLCSFYRYPSVGLYQEKNREKKNQKVSNQNGANVCDHINRLTGSHVQRLVHYDSHWCEV